MAIGREDVRRVAELARLRLSEEELEVFTPQLADILDHIDQLGELGGGTSAADDRRAPLRDDVVDPDPLAFPPERLAPEWRDGLFIVPRLSSQEQAGGES